MIWLVHTHDFLRFLTAQGFVLVGQTNRHDLFERGSETIQVRRADSLTQVEIDIICDAADLRPPRFDTFFGD